jgi:hypothetical protein
MHNSNDEPQVVFDVGGEVGSNRHKVLAPMARAGSFTLSRIDFSNAPRNRKDYSDARAEAYHVLLQRFEAGLSIPENDRLVSELTAFTSEVDSYKQARVSDKKALRKILNGKSPDLADALVMAVYVPAPWRPMRSGGSAPGGTLSRPTWPSDPFQFPPGRKRPFGY